jgi:hypothetical protein
MVMGGKSIGGGNGIGSISGGNCRCNSCGVGGLLQTLMHPQCSNMYLLNCRRCFDLLWNCEDKCKNNASLEGDYEK